MYYVVTIMPMQQSRSTVMLSLNIVQVNKCVCFIFYCEMGPGTPLNRVVSMGESPTKRTFNSQHVPETSVTNNDGLVNSIMHLSFTDNFTKPYSHEHLLSVNHCILI